MTLPFLLLDVHILCIHMHILPHNDQLTASFGKKLITKKRQIEDMFYKIQR